ncbi:hypothetical protein MRB53_000643 [Persea americana]|uniref:Uncharacterized protein n=1 Tax=Persea americana TaxID=3435 RepID=A0ACC2MPJ4_PERAE|nr:hypothetical protein MRB53_000643 [Persea americana]
MKLPLFFQFLAIFSILVSTNPTSAQCLDDQKSSLLTLFGSAHPPSWTPNTDCCIHWEGITCDGSTGHVTGLDLTNCSIRASINSTSLLSLSSLRNLNLSHNSFFDSSIPTSIGALSNLTHLNLSNSGFKGNVPVEISRVKSLESLDLSFSAFVSLSSLRFSSPDFEYVVGNLSGLRELYLDNVDISSPAPEPLAGLANLSEGEGVAMVRAHLDEEGGGIAVGREDLLVGVRWGGRRELVEGDDKGKDDKSGDE